MIAIIASNQREQFALKGLCTAQNWDAVGCESVGAFKRLLDTFRPKVVVTRYRLVDGYSDDVIASLNSRSPHSTKVIVLLPTSTPTSLEARVLELGAECTLRDPIRPEILIQYVAKYRVVAPEPRTTSSDCRIKIGQATLDPLQRSLQNGNRRTVLTPREVKLAQSLTNSRGEVLTYDSLFDDVLGRAFRGDTSNMRVLLRKLCASAIKVGLDLRALIQVIPKTGYRYIEGARSTKHPISAGRR